MTAKFKYKCRLCGKKYFNGLESSSKTAEMAMTTLVITGKDYNAQINKTMAVMMLETHHCNGYDENKPGYKVGVADLIGYEVEQ